jgi:hypothetical protein
MQRATQHRAYGAHGRVPEACGKSL